jgi:ABC-type glycerol-3-phosphate transport system substrate-binding protein
MGGWRAKILPIPKEITIATQTVNAEKKIVTVKQKKPGMSILDMRNRYVEGITKDLIVPIIEQVGKPPVDKIWGIPLSADSLALFYNRDILKKGSIEKPPTTWRDVQEHATKLTIRELVNNQPSEEIKQSGAAIGGSKNVSYFVDIVAALMQQNGAVLADEYGGGATFSEFTPESQEKPLPPGVEALMFYQSFAQPYSPNYSWNANMPLSFDAFLTGRTAFFFGFPSDIKKIRDRAPKLDFGLAPIPQVDPTKPSTILHYPVEVVAKQTDSPDEAWDFVHFLASEEQVVTFLTAAKRPTALRSIIGSQLTDPDIAPFAGQVLNARAWYRGADYDKVEDAFAYMIDFRPTIEEPDYWPIVANAASMVNTTLRY